MGALFVLAGTYAKLLFKGNGEIGHGAETCHISHLRYIVSALAQQPRCPIELELAEESSR